MFASLLKLSRLTYSQPWNGQPISSLIVLLSSLFSFFKKNVLCFEALFTGSLHVALRNSTLFLVEAKQGQPWSVLLQTSCAGETYWLRELPHYSFSPS